MPENNANRRRLRWICALAALTLVAGACGDDDDPAEDTASASATDESSSSTSAAVDDEPDAETDAEEPVDTDPVADEDDATETTEAEPEPEPADEPSDTTTTSAAPTTTEAAAPTTTLPAETGLPPEEERGENEAGVRIDLDETATLACANAEFARDSLRQSDLDGALQYTAAGADRAEPSAVVELADLAPEMREAQTADEIETVIDAVLAICVDRGHQI